VYISYSHEDKGFAHKIAEELMNRGFQVWIDKINLKPGDNMLEEIERGLKDSDCILVVLSQAYSRSTWVQRELSAFLVKESTYDKSRIIPILLQETEIPVTLRDRVWADFRGSFEEGLAQLLSGLRSDEKREPGSPEATAASRETTDSSIEVQLERVRREYSSGNLTLFCGAGVSVPAGIPDWSVLLETLLREVINADGMDRSSLDMDMQRALARLYQSSFNLSSLMIAQYLKNMLGYDFLNKLRGALYQSNTRPSPLIDAIVDLCRPRRSRSHLNSIITFNFDDLVEDALKKAKVKHRPIHYEGQKIRSDELPIYHVHGFLPRSGALDETHQVVFAEDAYHSQFIDSFSWSNLIQLNHLNQNLCLFIGLSMTDPNIRRLLDVSMRKSPDKTPTHYVFRRRYTVADVEARLEKLGISRSANYFSRNFIQLTETLEEQDLKNLGLNVIWIQDFAEIPDFLQRLLED
jgi:NAD-dependent SIR2 family protein deacetylase